MRDEQFSTVWRALADPTRRALLDLLRQRERTVGELARAFGAELSRFAVMKHLAVLARAGLVRVEPRGREHWYALNVVPLQQIYERWLRPYEGMWAASLLRLKQRAEGPECPETAHEERGTRMSTATNASPQVNLLHIAMEVPIAAPRQRVFTALTSDLAAWWGAPYLIGEHAKDMVLEPEVGGRMYEDWGEGQGGLWGIVTGVRTNEWIEVTGSIAMSGVVQGRLRYALEERDGGTLLKLTHDAMGSLSDATRSGYTSGWEDLLNTRLRAYLERGERMGLGHEPTK